MVSVAATRTPHGSYAASTSRATSPAYSPNVVTPERIPSSTPSFVPATSSSAVRCRASGPGVRFIHSISGTSRAPPRSSVWPVWTWASTSPGIVTPTDPGVLRGPGVPAVVEAAFVLRERLVQRLTGVDVQGVRQRQ